MLLLLAHGADVNRINANGDTPLIIAAHVGNATKVRLLLAAHADPRLKNHQGRTALSDARQQLINLDRKNEKDSWERQAIEQTVQTLEQAGVTQ